MLAVFAVAAILPTAHASPIFDTDASEQFKYQDDGKHWVEHADGLPPFPRDADLVPVQAPATATLKLFLDKHSITLGSDRVLRLTYVLQSPSGVRNVFYEGFRCGVGRYKTYAYGTGGRTYKKIARPTWQRIPDI